MRYQHQHQHQYQLEDLLYLMQRLRDPDTGCPWDIKQTFDTIVPHTLEEAHEVAEAIAEQDWPHVEEELGDLLFQVIFYSQLGREQTLFDFSSVINVLVTKLVRRHPHVFPNGDLQQARDANICLTEAEINAQWQQIKAQEKALLKERTATAAVGVKPPLKKMPVIDYLANIPQSLPALTRADKIQRRVALRGFDFTEMQSVIAKIHEELGEVEEELDERDEARLRHEVGDLLFACVNLSRHLDISPEQALDQANRRFSERYTLAAEALTEQQRSLELDNANKVSASEMEEAWKFAKKRHPQLQLELGL